MSAEKIALYGGTFNPPHLGHVRLLQAAESEIAFDRVFVVPDKRPVHKICEDLALDAERLEMCRLAFSGPRCTVSDMEIARPSDSYTVYTVRTLTEKYPQAELYLLMGSDMFLCFHKWYRWREIFERCTLCVASRQTADDLKVLRGYAFSQLRVYVKDHAGEHLRFLAAEPLEISSTALRAALAAGADTSRYLPAGVERYIREKGLYGYKAQR